MKRKNKLLQFFIPLISLTFILFVIPGFAEENQVTVYNTSDLKKALENPAGSSIKLGANIKFPANPKVDYAVEISKGKHILDLNGFTIEYSYINNMKEYTGTPIMIHGGNLSISGNGAIKGGGIAIENCGSAVLTINGGSYSGAAHSAIRIQGVTILNGGTLKGRFGDVWLEGGILIDNAGIVKKIDYTFKVPSATIRNGILNGKVELLAPITLKDLEVPVGSSLTINRNAILNITGALKGEERIKVVEGALIKNGVAAFKDNIRLTEHLTLNQLTVESKARLVLDENMKLTIKENLINNGRIDIQPGSMLIVEGDLTNSGELGYHEINDLLVEGNIIDNGIINKPNPDSGTAVADKLYILGLFQGTGTDPQGKPIYDLHVKPTRQVAITMLVRLLGEEKEALSSNLKHPFIDVDAWASPYIGYAYANGLTKGISDTKFGSQDLASANQYLTFVLRALGYNDAIGDFKWDKPTVLSEKIGLNIDGYKDNSVSFFRGDIAIISENSLNIKMKDSDINLLQHLLNNNAVLFENIIKAGLGHVAEP